MCSCINENESQQVVFLLPYEQPVGLYVALPAPLVLARQFVWKVLCWQLAFLLQNVKHRSKCLNIKATTNAQSQ